MSKVIYYSFLCLCCSHDVEWNLIKYRSAGHVMLALWQTFMEYLFVNWSDRHHVRRRPRFHAYQRRQSSSSAQTVVEDSERTRTSSVMRRFTQVSVGPLLLVRGLRVTGNEKSYIPRKCKFMASCFISNIRFNGLLISAICNIISVTPFRNSMYSKQSFIPVLCFIYNYTVLFQPKTLIIFSLVNLP